MSCPNEEKGHGWDIWRNFDNSAGVLRQKYDKMKRMTINVAIFDVIRGGGRCKSNNEIVASPWGVCLFIPNMLTSALLKDPGSRIESIAKFTWCFKIFNRNILENDVLRELRNASSILQYNTDINGRTQIERFETIMSLISKRRFRQQISSTNMAKYTLSKVLVSLRHRYGAKYRKIICTNFRVTFCVVGVDHKYRIYTR